MQEPVQITLPSGHVVWARVETPSGARAGTGPVDVGRGDPARAVRLEGLREPGA